MEKEWRSRGEGRGKWRDKALDALCARGGCWRVSVLRIPRRRETAGKNVKDNGMCRVAHAWLRGMRPRNGTSVSHNVCHETRGLIARNRSPPLSLSLRETRLRGVSTPLGGRNGFAGRKKNRLSRKLFPPRLLRSSFLFLFFVPPL